MNVMKPSIPMRSKPDQISSLETECLFGETIEILDKHSHWVYCKSVGDNYHGWVKGKSLGKFHNCTHRVIANRTFVYKEKNPKSQCIQYLPLGSKLFVNHIWSDWAEIFLYHYNMTAFVPSRDIVSIDHKLKDWVKISEQLNGTPYKWGGRDSLGIDCSSLLQLSYETSGNIIPRNTNEQVNLNKKEVLDFNDVERGHVIFWKGHVGIMIDKINCIHANAYHMKTTIEPIADIIYRMRKEYDIIKIMDFN